LLERYERVVDGLAAEVTACYGPRLVACAIFGSVARGTPRDGSDVDVLVVARDMPDGRMRRMEEFATVEENLAPLLASCTGDGPTPGISAVLKTPQEVISGTPLLLDMVEDARILFDRDGFLAARLDRLRRRLEELGSQRVWRGNAWHWVLKPDLKPGEVFEL
jgi:predicted nucleotidyltransferase